MQEREYYPLGSDLPKTADARIIVATNQNLQALQKSGRFRKDLYYRISTHHLHIPPLSKRQDDLPLLVEHFLNEASRSLGKKAPSYPPELMTLLSNYYFPGNIRELKTLIYDAVSNHKSKKLSMKRFQIHIDKERATPRSDKAEPLAKDGSWFSGSEPLPTFDQACMCLIIEAMKRTNNNQSMAARLLGISRQRLSRHFKTIRK